MVQSECRTSLLFKLPLFSTNKNCELSHMMLSIYLCKVLNHTLTLCPKLADSSENITPISNRKLKRLISKECCLEVIFSDSVLVLNISPLTGKRECDSDKQF